MNPVQIQKELEDIQATIAIFTEEIKRNKLTKAEKLAIKDNILNVRGQCMDVYRLVKQ